MPLAPSAFPAAGSSSAGFPRVRLLPVCPCPSPRAPMARCAVPPGCWSTHALISLPRERLQRLRAELGGCLGRLVQSFGAKRPARLSIATGTGWHRAPGRRRWLWSSVSPTMSLLLAETASVPAVPSAEADEGFFFFFFFLNSFNFLARLRSSGVGG